MRRTPRGSRTRWPDRCQTRSNARRKTRPPSARRRTDASSKSVATTGVPLAKLRHTTSQSPVGVILAILLKQPNVTKLLLRRRGEPPHRVRTPVGCNIRNHLAYVTIRSEVREPIQNAGSISQRSVQEPVHLGRAPIREFCMPHPFDLHRSQPLRAGRSSARPRRRARPRSIRMSTPSCRARRANASSSTALTISHDRAAGLKAHGDRVARFRCMRQADDPERGRIEVLDSRDRQPADRMRAQHAGQQSDGQHPVTMRRARRGRLVRASPPGALVGAGRSRRGSTAAHSRAARSNAAPVTPS